jgi:subtilisin family serine protease
VRGARAERDHPALAGVARWHSAGYRGRGVGVLVLDTGFRGYREALGSALPREVKVRSFRADGNLEARPSEHGILCAGVIHALAPEAELLFANWEPGRPERFLEAVRWARAQGARVISCSMIMPSWGDGEGGGPMHDALARLLGRGEAAGDLLCFASAGNTARRHWSGTFRAGPDGFHQWAPGQRDNAVSPWAGARHSAVELSCKPGPEYQLLVYEGERPKPLARSARPGRAGGGVAVQFRPRPGRRYRVRVRLLRGAPGAFHCTSLHSDLATGTPRGSVCFPADGPAVVAVGAVDRQGRRWSYSSCGPNSPRPKPDLMAAVPFPTSWRDRLFGGTSAAAPQAAGLAALWWSRHPDWNAARVRKALCSTARAARPGHSFETGYGVLRLP